MKLCFGIKKYQHVGLLFLIVSIAVNAASIVDGDSKFLESNQDVLFDDEFESESESIEKDVIDSTPEQQLKELPKAADKSLEQTDSPNNFLLNKQNYNKDFNSYSEQQTKKTDSDTTSTESKNISKSFSKYDATPNPFEINDSNIRSQRYNQKAIIENSQQLKELAHNLFGEETLEGFLNTQQDLKSRFTQADAWIREVMFDNRNWRLEDSIYGNAAIMFINDSSLIRFLRKFDDNSNDINQITAQLQQRDNSSQNKSVRLDSDSVLLSGYYSIIDLWNKYASTMIYLVLSVVIIRELIFLISKLLKPKKKTSSRSKSRNRGQPRGNKNAISNSISESKNLENTVMANVSGKQIHNSSTRTPAQKSRRRRRKRSTARKILDGVFAKPKYKQ